MTRSGTSPVHFRLPALILIAGFIGIGISDILTGQGVSDIAFTISMIACLSVIFFSDDLAGDETYGTGNSK